ncbi:MAG TPA: HNH endonuclease, partial [Actinobacteria bacterium]|nr:HNH endonuclease [Actinomycetota bacterium]
SIVRMVLDQDSMPIDVGRRTRTIPPALRRALDYRDQGCVWKGCTAPVSWCDAHHVIHWAQGGETTLDNLILLCRTHHTRIHKLHPHDNPRNYLRDTRAKHETRPPDT